MFLALGLMSGTSLDGVDAALIETDGRAVGRALGALTRPYDDAFRARLRGVLGGRGPVEAVERELTDRHAEAVEALLAATGMAPAAVRVVGFHGHTILHRPEERRTWQIGDGARLARRVGIAVVADFRSADVAAGGEGAPFAPVYHAALAARLPRPAVAVNIGGVANVTWIGPGGSEGGDRLIAFDTGPGNALIDDWVARRAGLRCDLDGRLSAAGRVDERRLARLLAHPYFDRPPPKSLDRDDFAAWAAGILADGGEPSAEDGAATLTRFTAAAIARAAGHMPEPPAAWVVCGGGRRNPALMAALAACVPAGRVIAAEDAGWDGDALEAQAFAYLAARSLAGLPLSFPETTRVPRPLTGGRLFRLAG